MRKITMWIVGCAMLLGPMLHAQDISGNWQGTLQAAKGQRIVLKVAKNGAAWSGVVYNLDADMAYRGHPTTQMSLQGAVLRFAIAPIEVVYDARLSDDRGSLAGTWTQGDKAYALELKRVPAGVEWEIPKADEAMPKDAEPAFEVATIKPSNPNDKNDGFQLHGRHINIENQTVNKLLLFAYGVHPKQVVDGPAWLESERFDIDGIPDVEGQPSLTQMQGMARKLLADRFKLKFHHEKREMPVYAIVVTNGGPKLTKNTNDPNGLPNQNGSQHGAQKTDKFENTSMTDLAFILQFFLDRPVVDQTRMAGRFDFVLKYTTDESQASDTDAAPGLFTAIQEELGLKLEPVKAPADVLVIDHVERPSAN